MCIRDRHKIVVYSWLLNAFENTLSFRVVDRLASVGILGKEREPGVGKLGWYGNFDTGFETLFRSKSRVRIF